MNGPDQEIEIFKPFGEAFELMKKILFQPFDLRKWIVIGFAAFLANLSGGLHFNGRLPTTWNRRDWHPFNARDWHAAVDQLPDWIRNPIFIGIAVTVFVALILIFSWLSARGRFIFTDCIVKNRGAIVLPWQELRKEANSFFLFWLVAGIVSFIFAILVSLPLVIFAIKSRPYFSIHRDQIPVYFIPAIAAYVFAVILFVFAWMLMAHFMVPIMYQRRCRAYKAFTSTASLFARCPGEFLLYCLFLIVLLIGTAVVGCVVMCATCCIAAIPYIGTVILLPIYVLLRGFSLCFLRQFGPDYDVWQEIAPLESPPIIPTPPPIPPPLQA